MGTEIMTAGQIAQQSKYRQALQVAEKVAAGEWCRMDWQVLANVEDTLEELLDRVRSARISRYHSEEYAADCL